MIALRIAAERLLASRLSKHRLLQPLLDGWRRRVRARRAAETRRTREQALALHGRTSADELLKQLREMGVTSGCTVFCQVSFNDMHTFGGGPSDLLAMLRELVGPEGTLAMPAYTLPDTRPQSNFDVRRTPTYTGLVNEIFRRSEGVLRSAHPRHSISAYGPLASHLTIGHERCARADGEDSPFDRLRQLPQAMIVTLGLPPGYISFLHWVEDIDPERFPIRLYQPTPLRLPVQFPDGSRVVVADWVRREKVAASLAFDRVARRLSGHAMNFAKYKEISIGVYRVDVLAKELLALRDEGIVHYH